MLRNLPKVMELLSAAVSTQNSSGQCQTGCSKPCRSKCGPQAICPVITREYHAESQVPPSPTHQTLVLTRPPVTPLHTEVWGALG